MALTDLLEKIDALKQEADSLRPIPKDRVVKLNDKLRLEWTYHSNAIEGNTLTLSETRVLLQQGIHMGNKLGRHYEEMKLHEEVILALEEIVHDKRPFSEVLIRQLHHRLMGDDYFVDAFDSLGEPKKVKGKPGEYKDMTNGVRRIVNGKEKFVPFKTPDEVRMEMPELVQWYLEDEQKQEYHPVVRAALLHYRFVTIHPFDDGNGRMGRILMNLALMRSGYVPAIVRVEEREAYLRNLAIAQDGGDLEPFLELVAEETLQTMQLLVKAAKGENIEEPEDIEKRVAIFKKAAIFNKGNYQEKSNLTAIDLFRNSFKSIFELLLSKTQNTYHDLFANILKYVSIEAANDTSWEWKDIADVDLYLSTALANDKEVHRIVLSLELQHYLGNSHKTFSVSTKLQIDLEPTFYKVSCNNRELVLRLYNQPLMTDEENKKLISEILTDIFEQIQQNIKA